MKKERISGSAAKKGNFEGVLTQVKQCFRHSYPDPGEGEVPIDRCVVVASGDIAQAAQEEFAKECERQRPMLRFIDGPELVLLVDTHMPELFWEEREQFEAYYAAIKKETATIRDLQAFELDRPLEMEKVYVSLRLEGTQEERAERQRGGRGRKERPSAKEIREVEAAMQGSGAKMGVDEGSAPSSGWSSSGIRARAKPRFSGTSRLRWQNDTSRPKAKPRSPSRSRCATWLKQEHRA